jgi:integrase/recombinase XerD
MTDLSFELDRYLTIRRSLGHGLKAPEGILRRFVSFASAQDTDRITTHLFMQWHGTFGAASRETWAMRYTAVRLFACWMHGLDPKHEVPPARLMPYRHRRQRPYIYSEEQIRSILLAASALRSKNGLRGATYSVLFGLIAVTGLRVSEALSLNVSEVNLNAGMITVLRGKFGSERVVPIEETTRRRLFEYAVERDRLFGKQSIRFFVNDQGGMLAGSAARYNFANICQRIGLREPQRRHGHGRGPRIHDLRHTFAVRTLIGWYRSGRDPNREMIKLTTYLGHTEPAHTYWYIEAVPELLELASKRADGRPSEEVLS